MGQTNFLQALGWAVLNSLWQMALLWMIYQGVIAIFKNIKSSAKSSLAVSLLIAGFAWFVFTFISIFANYSSDEVVISSSFINTDGNEQLNNWLHQTLPAASILYLILLILPLLHFGRNYRYVQVIRNNGLSKADVQWRMFVKKVAAHLGIKKTVRIWISELVSSPVTIGYLKPVILIPMAAINHLTTQQVEAVLLHELSHIRRYDYLINLVINSIQTVLYFNPFVKSFVKIVEKEREKSCDEMVMQFQYDSHEYATALLILEKTNQLSKSFVLAAAGKNDLLNRVETILGVHKKSVLSFNRIAGLFAALLCIIGVNALLIMSRPNNMTSSPSFSAIASPFYFFSDNVGEEAAPVAEANHNNLVENHTTPIINHKRQPGILKPRYKPMPVAHVESFRQIAPVSNFINVSFAPIDVPELKKYQEAQIKKAIATSKRVMENAQWKALEKKVADVYTQQEKLELREAYKAELDKMDWNKMEDKLRIAYDKIDWDQINDQLHKAINAITLDSLQTVLNAQASQLNEVQTELSKCKLKGIPDTDITLKEVEQKKQEVRKTLNTIQTLRTKKVISL